MEEPRLAYRVRTAETSDEAKLRAAIGSTLVHPDRGARRESYRGAAERGDVLVLERFDRPEKEWLVAGFVEYHMRVDDQLSIRDAGTAGEEPQAAVVRYLLDQLFASYKPVSALVKIRRDAEAWLGIFGSIPGFYLEGEEYRRPHYWTIWRWDQEHVRQASSQVERPGRVAPRPPGPRPPSRPFSDGRSAAPSGPRGPVRRPGQQPRRPDRGPGDAPRGPSRGR